MRLQFMMTSVTHFSHYCLQFFHCRFLCTSWALGFTQLAHSNLIQDLSYLSAPGRTSVSFAMWIM